MKKAPGFKAHSIFLLTLLLACAIFLAGCIGDTSSNSSPSSNAQSSPITPVGAPTTCLTVHSPSLAKLADGNYELMDEIDNCGGNAAGPLKVTAQIDVQNTKQQSASLPGPTMIPAHGNALYHTFTGQTGGTNKELQFHSPSSSSAAVTILATINGSEQGEWDGQISIPR